MSIEISQLSINTTISNKETSVSNHNVVEGNAAAHQELDMENLRQSILADCKALINDMLERQRDR